MIRGSKGRAPARPALYVLRTLRCEAESSCHSWGAGNADGGVACKCLGEGICGK